MSILITGAAGFIGSHLCFRLLEEGNTVVGVDNFRLGKIENLKESINNPNFTFIETDIVGDNFKEQLKPFSKNIKAIWHLAASSDIQAGAVDYNNDLSDTFRTTTAVCEFAEENDIKNIYFSSTGAVYGEHEGKLHEKTLCSPISFYGTFKLASENFLRANHHRFFKKVVIYRFSNIIGSNATHGVIYDFVNKLIKNNTTLEVLGDGTQQKPYLHVDDLMYAMLFINSNTKNGYHVFNIGPDDEGVTVKDIANKVVNSMLLNSKIQYGDEDRGWVGDIPKVRYSNQKLTSFGWSPSLSSAEAVDKAVEEIISENFH